VDEDCVNGVCTCALTLCGAACVDVQTDEANCGACGHACLDGANETATTCISGACVPSCVAGFGDCTTPQAPAADNGCETDLNSTASCGTTCGNAVTCGLGASCLTSVCRNQGVEILSLPFTAAGQGQRYNAQNTTLPPPQVGTTYNLSGQTVTIRVYAPGATGGDLSVFFRSNSGANSVATKVALSTMTAGFTDVVINVPVAGGGYDPALTDVIRIEPETDPAFGSSWLNPTIIVIDSIVSSNGVVDIPFTTAPTGSVFSSSGARPLAGSTNVWANLYP
jgi:hypothetical protein